MLSLPLSKMSGSALACKMHRYNDGKTEKLSQVSQNADYTYDKRDMLSGFNFCKFLEKANSN